MIKLNLKKNDTNIKEAIAELDALSYVNPLNPKERIFDNKVAVSYVDFDGSLYIFSFRAFETGLGHGTVVLKNICEIADKYKVPIKLSPESFGDNKMDNVKLEEFYSRFGFKKTGNFMVRNNFN